MKIGAAFKDTIARMKDAFSGGSYVEENYYENDGYESEEESDYEEIAKPKSGFGNVKKMEQPYTSAKQNFSFVQKSTEKKEKTGEERIMIYSPKSSSDATAIADSIKDGKVVVLNILDSPIADDEAQRICDYLVGVCYAVEADCETIMDNILLMTPKGCRVTNAEKSQIRRSSMGLASGFGR
jgi:cell division inhibitor SepF